MTLDLRPYQREAIEAVQAGKARGVDHALVALPTGTGKTVVFSHLIKERGGSALILAHRDELLAQAEDKLRVVAPELAMCVGRVQADRDDTNAPIVTASVATLANQSRLDRLPREWDTVIVDEAHHATADSYRRIIDHLDADLVVGFTATPERHDDSKLADVFDEIVYARGLLQMIEAGYLCNLRGTRVELSGLDMSSVKVTRGEYQKDDLGRAMTEAHAQEHTAAALLEHAADRKSLVFVPTVALAHETAAAINAAGIPAAALSGMTAMEERRDILARLTSGELRAVVNVDVLTEGFDEPSVDCIAIAAPTRSRIVYVQRVGRGTRIHPGKQDCLILKLQSLPNLFELRTDLEDDESVTAAAARERAESAGGASDDPGEPGAVNQTARDADLFGRDRLHWLDLGGRWALSAGGGESLILDPVNDTAWKVLLLGEDRARVLARDLDLGYAQGAAEEAVRRRGAMRLADSEAEWRKLPVSDGQWSKLRRLGVAATPMDRGEASDLIEVAKVTERLERLDAAVDARKAVAA